MTTRAGALCCQPVQQQVGEQERREMVEGEGALEPVGGDVPGVPVAADVVDQHVEPGQALEYLGGQPAHLRLGGEVGDEHVDLPAAGCADLAGRGLGASAVPAGDRQVRAHRGQAERGRLADAAGGTGDQHGPTGHRPGWMRVIVLPLRRIGAWSAMTDRVVWPPRGLRLPGRPGVHRAAVTGVGGPAVGAPEGVRRRWGRRAASRGRCRPGRAGTAGSGRSSAPCRRPPGATHRSMPITKS